ncbi:MAG TPA: WD40 repeat domain-containing protein [Candidatus Paceibacterota bacterium]|nr:WD40 repeat domain-containing protein [Candidatus Paceibacterota bacterium]
MFLGQQPNLLSQRSSLRRSTFLLLLVIPFVALAVIVGAFLGNGGTATIAEHVDGSSTPEPRDAPRVVDTLLSDTAATGLAPGLSRDSVRWFDVQSGRAYEGDLRTGVIRTISDIAVPGFTDGIWVPGAEQAFLIIEDARSGRRYQLYDYRTGSGHTLENADHLAVSSNGSRIAYIGPGTDSGTVLRVADVDGSDERTILRTRLGVTDMAWKGEQAIILTVWRTGTSSTDLVVVSLDGDIATLLSNKQNLEFTISRQGSVLATYFDQSAKRVVAVLDPSTLLQRTMSEQTSARKCAWAPDGASLVCGIPQDASVSQGSALAATNDTLASIDAGSGVLIDTIPTHEDRVGVYSPVISSSGTRAAFIDLFDRRVHMVSF